MFKNIEKIRQLLSQNYPKVNVELVERAYNFAEMAHQDNKRFSGEPQINHSVNTALHLAEWKLPINFVVAGLLHDVPEYTKYTIADIETNFSRDVAKMVEGEMKLDSLRYRGEKKYAENLRQMFISVADDVRIIFIKFADRIDNLKSLSFLPENKQKRLAIESLEIYAPIANRLGMDVIRQQLEDLSFKYVYPEDYEKTLNLVKNVYATKEGYLEKIRKIVSKDLVKGGIRVAEIHSRKKGLYGVYKKLAARNWNPNNIYDIFASRIIVESESDCYSALGILHHRWKPVKGRIKDYISQPKPNGYQSLHTTVFCEDGKTVEFQIRTKTMHEEDEYGLASHWFYREQGEGQENKKKHIAWLREFSKIQKEIKEKTKFFENIDSLKTDIFQKRIFVFTPKGDIINLPENATPVDFAYAIHTELGHKYARAKVNDELVSDDYKLLSGDKVEIIIERSRKKPDPAWLKSIKTRKARMMIKEKI
ncbi:MAG: RelA/SpoT family protein [Patescibacteria group bacterium]|nr:RelA/SpoT family protein [Patescibacteria group bacterium]MDD5490476.1 RelA/SpoT family protein [Patescibacteria group bacterium]